MSEDDELRILLAYYRSKDKMMTDLFNDIISDIKTLNLSDTISKEDVIRIINDNFIRYRHSSPLEGLTTMYDSEGHCWVRSDQ